MNSSEHAKTAADALWANKESRDRLIKLRRNPEYKTRVSLSMKKAWEKRDRNISEERKNKISHSVKNAWILKTQEERKLIGNKISISKEGFKFSNETKAKMSLIAKGKHNSPATEITSEQMKKKWQDPEYRSRMSELSSKRAKDRWADSEKKDEWVRNILRAKAMPMSSAEVKLQTVLDRFYPGEWKYVGDGTLIIAGKCPDFINVNGLKKIIEVFSDYFHRGQNPQNRIDAFKPFGYETLVLWTKDVRSMKRLKPKLEEFCGVI